MKPVAALRNISCLLTFLLTFSKCWENFSLFKNGKSGYNLKPQYKLETNHVMMTLTLRRGSTQAFHLKTFHNKAVTVFMDSKSLKYRWPFIALSLRSIFHTLLEDPPCMCVCVCTHAHVSITSLSLYACTTALPGPRIFFNDEKLSVCFPSLKGKT